MTMRNAFSGFIINTAAIARLVLDSSSVPRITFACSHLRGFS